MMKPELVERNTLVLASNFRVQKPKLKLAYKHGISPSTRQYLKSVSMIPTTFFYSVSTPTKDPAAAEKVVMEEPKAKTEADPEVAAAGSQPRSPEKAKLNLPKQEEDAGNDWWGGMGGWVNTAALNKAVSSVTEVTNSAVNVAKAKVRKGSDCSLSHVLQTSLDCSSPTRSTVW